MKQSILIFLFVLFTHCLWGQSKPTNIFFSAYKNDSTRYSKTDFALIDTLDKWCYRFRYDLPLGEEDSIAPICIVRFTRTSPLCDSTGFLEAKEIWGITGPDSILEENIYFTPNIYFKVFYSKDYNYAFNLSKGYKMATGCIAPYGGGDIFKVGDYVFVNTSLCLSCSSVFWGKIDYCRPLLNFVFSQIKYTKNENLESIFKHLVINNCN